ncbi:MAG: DNA helicase UvrBC [Planctomycetota bacterium]|jgi:protein arginine kinase activator|nr:UvrB/UvrC motif-containing protein [Planctomycetales bacterium]RLT01556.1 MAG: DNA helicase UvrBC [Planctomycetota bacterium]
MKKCRRCTKPATLHVTEIREGEAAIVHLCDTCAKEYLEQRPDDTPPTIGSDLASKLDELIGAVHSPASCPNCGISFNEFRDSGRFGCSQDYPEFLAELLPLLENIHEGVEHKGKRPRSTVVGTQEQGQLIQLRNAQRNAIEQEDYETAARLRDEIVAIENAVREEKPKKTRKKKKPAAPE